MVGMALTPDDGGYYMAGAVGNVYGFGKPTPALCRPDLAPISPSLPSRALSSAGPIGDVKCRRTVF
jgi:hypothetical protein